MTLAGEYQRGSLKNKKTQKEEEKQPFLFRYRDVTQKDYAINERRSCAASPFIASQKRLACPTLPLMSMMRSEVPGKYSFALDSWIRAELCDWNSAQRKRGRWSGRNGWCKHWR